MFVKLTKSGPRRYVQLVESFRDEHGRTRQRTIASLGRLEQLERHVDSVVQGLQRVTGRDRSAALGDVELTFQPARALGDVWSLTALWRQLGFDGLAPIFASAHRSINVEALVRIMVFNRLCDPESKLGLLRWLETVSLPALKLKHVEYHHLLRAMDALNEHHSEVEQVTSKLLRPLVDQTLSLVYYDLTTISTEGLSEQIDELRYYGKSKDGGIKRQFVLGVVQTAEGLPIYHEVFAGNVAEVKTLRSTLERVLERFPIQRVIAVADRGLLSVDNLAELAAMRLPSGQALEFIVAVAARRYSDFTESLRGFHDAACTEASEEVFGEARWQACRLIMAHDPVAAKEQTQRRDAKINELEAEASAFVHRLEQQERGHRSGGRSLSDNGACAKFYHAVCDAHLSRIIRVDLKGDLFNYYIDEHAKARAELNDGKLLLVTNTTDQNAQAIVAQYKQLADIERGFRVLKSELEIAPLYHRLPDRIRAHAHICFIALILHRVMRLRLKAAQSSLSPERALQVLQRIQHHQVELNGKAHTGISCMSQEQLALLAALEVKTPRKAQQLTLL